MKLKFTPPVVMALAAAAVLATSAGAAWFMSGDEAASQGVSPMSVTVGRKHVYSENLPAQNAAKAVTLNETVPDFQLADVKGEQHSLAQWKGKPVVFIFADTVCPCVKAYKDRVRQLATEYSAQGLQVVYVFSDAKVSAAQARQFTEQQGIQLTSLYDADQKLLNLFNARCTTEAFLLDAEGKLRYHGRIDDSTYNPEQVKVRDLNEAIVAVLANKKVAKPETEAYGCAFVRKEGSSIKPIKPAFNPEIKPES